VLSEDEESILVAIISTLADHAFPLDKLGKHFVQSFLNSMQKQVKRRKKYTKKRLTAQFQKKTSIYFGDAET